MQNTVVLPQIALRDHNIQTTRGTTSCQLSLSLGPSLILVDPVVEPQAVRVITQDSGLFADGQIEDCRCEWRIDTGCS